MTHARALVLMLLATLMWSSAGVVTRQLEHAAPFEVSFWRSLSTALALVALLGWQKGFRRLMQDLLQAPRLLWLSGACWGVMFTAFMVALTMTTVANVLITEALTPIFTALIARSWLGHRLPRRTWIAIALAGAGVVWMYGSQIGGGTHRDLAGVLIALCVPLASAWMWILLQVNARRHPDQRCDMSPAVLIGALISSLACLPMSLPLESPSHDVLLLSGLGVFQLAIPCVLAIRAGRVLKAPEAALLAMLEILFGVAWTWWSGQESPTLPVLCGGLVVLAALAINESLALRGAAFHILEEKAE
jgi:drug/metabolite transporter (DMT)-like permease